MLGSNLLRLLVVRRMGIQVGMRTWGVRPLIVMEYISMVTGDSFIPALLLARVPVCEIVPVLGALCFRVVVPAYVRLNCAFEGGHVFRARDEPSKRGSR